MVVFSDVRIIGPFLISDEIYLSNISTPGYLRLAEPTVCATPVGRLEWLVSATLGTKMVRSALKKVFCDP